MRTPITKRLLTAASLVPQGARVADIGCDHGYLGIHLLQQGQASYVCASDLREMPLASAKRNSEKFGTAEQMDFCCIGGFGAVQEHHCDTIVCAGMGGDLIRSMIEAAPWVRDEKYTLILQPQSGVPDFRRWLAQEGFTLEAETPVFDEGFVYSAMRLRYTGEKTTLSCGEAFVTKQLLASQSPDVLLYIDRMLDSIQRTLDGLKLAANPGERLNRYQAAFAEITEMRKQYDNRRTNQ